VFSTEQGLVKRTEVAEFSNPRAGGVAAVSLRAGDRLSDVQLSDGSADVVLVTASGRGIRFNEADVPVMGRAAQGVAGIKLRESDSVVGMVVVRRDASVCTVTERGYAKRTELAEFPVQKRGGLGTVAMSINARTGALVTAKELLPGDELMLISAAGRAVRLNADDMPSQGRTTQGRPTLELSEDDRIVEVTRVADRDERGDDGSPAEEIGDEGLEPAPEQFELLALGDD
jgi:DNA gyrase subunit A